MRDAFLRIEHGQLVRIEVFRTVSHHERDCSLVTLRFHLRYVLFPVDIEVGLCLFQPVNDVPRVPVDHQEYVSVTLLRRCVERTDIVDMPGVTRSRRVVVRLDSIVVERQPSTFPFDTSLAKKWLLRQLHSP